MTYHTSRRKFLGSVPCLAVGSSTLYSSLINLKSLTKMISSTTMSGGDYKALVCIMLSGGNDSFNMVIPRGNTEYAEYAAARSNLAIPQADLLPISPTTTDGRTYGLHPNLTGLQQIFANGRAAFINNVGTMVEPVTKSMIESGGANLPLGLFSHIDQAMHWQTAIPQDRSSIGWGGRMADILKELNTTEDISMNISLGGNNIFQRGEEVVEFATNNDGGVSIIGWDTPHPFFQLINEDVTDMMNKQYEDIFKDSYTGTLKRSVESNEVFNTAIENTAPLTTQFAAGAGNLISQDLRMVADSIAARETLGNKRQIFFVEMGGFDNHDELLGKHGGRMASLDRALTSFYAAMEELGVGDCVTTYTVSDFARTLSSNGNGTDHAWGGNAIVMGGAVKGREMYGDYPVLSVGSDLDLGNGRLLPTTSADSYFAELALWFGISPSDLSLILPNIGNFYSYDPDTAPLGFLL